MLEKAAANISVVAGVLSPERAKAMSSRGRSAIDPAGGQSYSGEPLLQRQAGWRWAVVWLELPPEVSLLPTRTSPWPPPLPQRRP